MNIAKLLASLRSSWASCKHNTTQTLIVSILYKINMIITVKNYNCWFLFWVQRCPFQGPTLYTQLFTKQSLHNLTKLYKTLQNVFQIYTKHIQNSSKLYKTFQNFYKTWHNFTNNFTKLYTQLYTSVHNSKESLKSLQTLQNFTKLYENIKQI